MHLLHASHIYALMYLSVSPLPSQVSYKAATSFKHTVDAFAAIGIAGLKTHTHTHTHTRTRIRYICYTHYTYIHSYMYLCLYLCLHLCLYLCLYQCLSVCLCVYVSVYTQTYTQTHIYTRTYIHYAHTYTTHIGEERDAIFSVLAAVLHLGNIPVEQV